ncbi:MAG TPA: hypothetical protein VEQ58_18905, partial [Polyangiaceae bacterium]|nr:hypothetical protein [Polyangiaceae bacterium]
LGAGIAERDRVRFDLALDLLIPPLSSIVVGLVVCQMVAVALVAAFGAPGVSMSLFGLGLVAVVAYVMRGWMLSGTGARGLADLAFAPFYIAWKLALRFRKPPRATSEWVRTKREAGDAPP